MIECSSYVQAEPGDYLLAEDVRDWITELPPGARLSPITRERRTQRDPILVLLGLRADWSENR